jgi:hypothetical protein
MKKHISKIGSIVFSTSVVIFSLAAAFSGTIAWFNTTKAATVSAGSFQVVAPEGVSYDLYYLDNFILNVGTKDGNYDTTTEKYIGYEVAEGVANFTQVKSEYEEGEANPTVISDLWPNHFLTFAIVVNSGSVSNFKLTTWSERRNAAVVNDEATEISLSWATNIYSKAYYVEDSNDDPDISSGFTTFNGELTAQTPTVVNKFKYDENNNFDEDHRAPEAPLPKNEITFFDSIAGSEGNNKHIIVYFSIEFSNNSNTFYTYDKEHNYYVKDNDGNSNCYKSLQLFGLNFSLS